MPDGEEATLPLPVPSVPTVSAYVSRVNVAVTDFAASTVTTHAPEPVQAPDHDANVDPVEAVGVSVTDVPWS